MNLSREAINWLATGERGISSNAMFQVILGVPALSSPWDTVPYGNPEDPDDFRRCLLLVESVPEVKQYLKDMKYCSKMWSDLIDHWDELCDIFKKECPDWKNRFCKEVSCEKTYNRMREIIEKAQKEQPTWKPDFSEKLKSEKLRWGRSSI